MLKIEYDTKLIKLLAREIVKELKRAELAEQKEPELLSSKAAAEYLGITEDYLRKIKHRLPYQKQGTHNQGRLVFQKQGLFDAYMSIKKV